MSEMDITVEEDNGDVLVKEDDFVDLRIDDDGVFGYRKQGNTYFSNTQFTFSLQDKYDKAKFLIKLNNKLHKRLDNAFESDA